MKFLRESVTISYDKNEVIAILPYLMYETGYLSQDKNIMFGFLKFGVIVTIEGC